MKNCYLMVGVFYVFCVANQVFSAPADSTLSLVVSSTEASNGKEGKEDTVVDLKVPQIYEMHIKSNISNRFANTTIVSKVRNIATESQEATFSIILPKDAFISGFIMEVNGKNYTAYVKEKEEAKAQYDSAVASGLGAAHVAVSARDSNKFTVSVNIEPETKAAFYLSYEELLKRKDGRYENIINIHPGQPVKDFSVEVLISESRKITDLKAPPLRSGNEIGNENEELDPRADIEILSDSSALVKFSPNEERQKQLAHLLKTDEKDGLAGQFVVQYDVERDPRGGEVLVRDGYFVHFFAPTELQPLPKHVVFVLDVSGSMYGTKITQLKEAMQKILDQLHEKDLISLVEFSTSVKVWNLDKPLESSMYFTRSYYGQSNHEEITMDDMSPKAYPATALYIKRAKDGVNEFRADGGTNIIGSLQVGLRLVESSRQNKIDDIDRQPLIIFLTDGEANVGDSSTESIIKKITSENSGLRKTPIFSLSFGYGADKKFLEKLSLRNMGFSKHIYEASDAALQLEDFYNQISSPLLSDVTFKYESSEVTDVTKTHFPVFYDGSEVVVSGCFGGILRRPVIEGVSSTGLLNLTPRVENSASDIERLWAYLTVKQLLEKKEITDENVEEIKKKALDLSLKYSFVTPLSSLVVIKPNETNAVDAEEAGARPSSPGGHGGFYPSNRMGSSSSWNYAAMQSPQGLPGQSGGIPLSVVGYPQSGMHGPPGPPGISYDAHFISPTLRTNSIVSSTAPTTNSYLAKSSNNVNNLDATLPWIRNILIENGFLHLPMPIGNFKLGPYKTIIVNPPCSNAPSGGSGKCTLLKDCPKVHSLLTSVDIYVQHFCPLEIEYAGVCCPTTTAI